MGAIETAMCSMSHCLCVTSMPAIPGSNWTTMNNRRHWTGQSWDKQKPQQVMKEINWNLIWPQISFTRTQQATHQIFGTHADNPRSSLRFSDSRYHSSTQFFSWCTQNIRYFGPCSSLDSPSPCIPLQPVEQSPRRKTQNIQKRQTQGALSSIHALPWRKLFCVHLFHTHKLSGGVCFTLDGA